MLKKYILFGLFVFVLGISSNGSVKNTKSKLDNSRNASKFIEYSRINVVDATEFLFEEDDDDHSLHFCRLFRNSSSLENHPLCFFPEYRQLSIGFQSFCELMPLLFDLPPPVLK